MLTVGDRFPRFDLTAVVGGEFTQVSNASHPGQWLVVFYWPMDFTFVCPTEIAEFGRHEGEFRARQTQVLGASTDTHYVHLAWKQQDPQLRDLPFPMLADHTRALAQALGIVHREAGVTLRATFIVDPDGVIRWVNVNDLSVGRSVPETLRVLDALRTGELTPCGWTPGQATLSAAARAAS